LLDVDAAAPPLVVVFAPPPVELEAAPPAPVEEDPAPPVEEGAEEPVDDEAPVGAAAAEDLSVTTVDEGAAAEEAAEEEPLALLAPPALTSLQISAVRLRTAGGGLVGVFLLVLEGVGRRGEDVLVRSVGLQVEATQGAAAVLMAL
jgi:hypothetical protein